MHLVFVGNDSGYFVSHRLPLALHALKAGYRVSVVLPDDKRKSTLELHGFECHTFPFERGGMNPLIDIASVVALYNIYRRLKPDVVHHLTVKPALYGGLAARLAGVPRIVAAFLGLGFLFFDSSFKTKTVRFSLKPLFRVALNGKNTRIICQNPDDLETLIDYGAISEKDRIRTAVILGSGVDPTEYPVSPIPASGIPIALLASRMILQKGIPTFVEAAKILKHRQVAVRLVLCGGTDPTSPNGIPEEQIRQWAEAGWVEWWGHQSEMPAVFAQASIVVAPSEYGEGIPKSLIEAASCGRPIVATDVPGCREVARAGKNGELVPPLDPIALATAIERLIGDQSLLTSYGKYSRQMIEHEFALEHVLKQTMSLYQPQTP